MRNAIARTAGGFYHEPTQNKAAESRGRKETESMYLTQALHRAAQQHPERVAVRFGDRQSSFGELNDRVARQAAALQALGIQRGDRVAKL